MSKTNFSLMRSFIAFIIQSESSSLNYIVEKAGVRIRRPLTMLDIYLRPHLIQHLITESKFNSMFAEYILRFDGELFATETNIITPIWLVQYLKKTFKEFFVQ